jgi:hypothetical protein
MTEAMENFEEEDQVRKGQTDEEEDEEEDDELEIEFVDDVPEDEKPRSEKPVKPEEPDEDELEQYSDRVQKRIKSLTFDAKEAARQAAQAARERDEAVAYARRINEQNQALQKNLDSGRSAYITQSKSSAEARVKAAERAYAARMRRVTQRSCSKPSVTCRRRTSISIPRSSGSSRPGNGRKLLSPNSHNPSSARNRSSHNSRNWTRGNVGGSARTTGSAKTTL